MNYANGNTTARPGQTLLWIAEDRLGTVNAAGGGEIETHMYDPEGFRWLKADASGTTRYINRWYERNVTTGGEKVHYWLGDRLVAERDDAVVRYMSLDSLESPTAVSASDGTSSWRAYHPWGDLRTSSGSFGTDRGFTGQYADSVSGLSFYNARYYDATLGRFISPDSVVPDPNDPRSYNRYAYVLNNPLKYTDPSGHCVGPARKLPGCATARNAVSLISTHYANAVNAVNLVADSANAAAQITRDLFGEQVKAVQVVDVPDMGRSAEVAVLNDRSILGRAVNFINGSPAGGAAVTLGFGPYDILATRELGSYGKDELARHEYQHLREIDEYGPVLWHGTYQAENIGRTLWWAFGGFQGNYDAVVHDQIGKESRADAVADNRIDPASATDDAFWWLQDTFH